MNQSEFYDLYLKSGYKLGPIACSDEFYRQSFGVGQSTLKLMERSPAKCLWDLEHPKKSTEAQELGTAIHCALLEPDVFEKTYVIKPKFDKRTTAGKAAALAWDESNQGRIGIDPDNMDILNRVASRVFDNEFYSSFFKEGLKENSFWSKDQISGVAKRARLDNFITNKKIIVDLKTTDCAYPDIFSRDIWKYKYHVQAAYYVDIVKEVTGLDCSFFIVAVEKTKDCDVTVHMIGHEALSHGRALYRGWLDDYAKAIQNKVWPGYKQEIHTYSIPSWVDDDCFEWEHF